MNKNNANNLTVPAFILSCERSGSTLLRYIIDTHPDIVCTSQLYLGKLCHDLYLVVARTAGAVSTIADEAEKKRMVLAEVRRIVTGLMDRYAAAKNKRIWCDKTTINLDYLDIIKAVFPDAKYICLYRNAMDVVHSCIETSRLRFMHEHIKYVHRHPRNIVSAMVEGWIDKTRTLLEFEQQNSTQCFRIKYESYVLNSAKVLEPMFTFLGVAWDANLLDNVFSVDHDRDEGDSKAQFTTRIHQDSIGKGSTINRHHIPERLLKEMNTLLEELDYPVVGPDWDTEPSPYRPMDSMSEQASVASNVGEFFTNHLPQRLNEPTNKLQAGDVIYKIVVTGEGGGVWMVDLTKPSNQIAAGDENADCTITISSKDFVDMINSNLNPAEAWLQGKVHVAGDLTQAKMFGQFLLPG